LLFKCADNRKHGPSQQFIDRDDLGRRTFQQTKFREEHCNEIGTQDEAEGKWHKAKGKVKEIAGN